MADDEFDLSPEMSADPLDLSGFGVTPQPNVLGPGGSTIMGGGMPRGGIDMKKYAPLLALLPIAAQRGGMSGVAALLQGFQQGQMRQKQEARLATADQRATASQESLDAYRHSQIENQRQQIENQKLQRQNDFRSKFAAGLEGLDNDEAIRAYLDFQRPQAESLGINAGALDAFALQSQTPSRLQKRAAEKQVAKLKNQFGEKWIEQGAKFTHQIGGESVSFTDLLTRAGLAPDPNAPTVPDSFEGNTPEKAHLSAYARRMGKPVSELTDVEIQQATKAFRQSDDRPRDPVLNEIAELRRDQLRNTPMPTLPAATQRRVDQLVKGFDSQPAVKNAQKMAEAVSFANSLDPNTKNPADDQALIYAFAKAMDPDSVVREGEYATVQKYAQSWADNFGFNAARIFSNTAFLSAQARANMKATIQTKFRAGRSQYESLRKSYSGRIDKITGAQDGDTYLTDYGAAFPADPAQTDHRASALEKLRNR